MGRRCRHVDTAVAATVLFAGFRRARGEGGQTARRSRLAALIVAGLTGGARMYAGSHLPLDIAGGVAIGVLCGRWANAVFPNSQST